MRYDKILQFDDDLEYSEAINKGGFIIYINSNEFMVLECKIINWISSVSYTSRNRIIYTIKSPGLFLPFG